LGRHSAKAGANVVPIYASRRRALFYPIKHKKTAGRADFVRSDPALLNSTGLANEPRARSVRFGQRPGQSAEIFDGAGRFTILDIAVNAGGRCATVPRRRPGCGKKNETIGRLT